MSRAPWNNVLHPAAGAAGLPLVTASAAAGHRRLHNEYVLKGLLSKEEIDEIVSCGDRDNFICEQVGLFHSFPGDGDVTEDDHAWCEFYFEDDHGFSRTDKEPTVTMTARELLDSFRKAKGNWDEARYLPENIY